MYQLVEELDNTLLTVRSEVGQAIAEVESTYYELHAAVSATLSYDNEVRYLEATLNNAFADDARTVAQKLDQLIEAVVQLSQSENAWVRAEADHMKAFVNLHLATGTLLNGVEMPISEQADR